MAETSKSSEHRAKALDAPTGGVVMTRTPTSSSVRSLLFLALSLAALPGCTEDSSDLTHVDAASPALPSGGKSKQKTDGGSAATRPGTGSREDDSEGSEQQGDLPDGSIGDNSAGSGSVNKRDGQVGPSSNAGATQDAGAEFKDDAGRVDTETVCPAKVLSPGDSTTTLTVGSAKRTFILHVPSSYNGKTAVPLVTDWHALGSSGAGQEMLSGWRALSDSNGFVVAWPDGIDMAWNVGPCCTTSRSVDDLAFAKALVADIEKRACIDPKRVYATGFSMGGGMSQYLGCNAADLFAAIAPAAFDLLSEEEEPCKPARPISIIQFRSTGDPVVPYAGGPSDPPNGLNTTIHFRGAEANIKHWAELNGCTGMPEDTGGGCMTYGNCTAGTEATLCTTQGGTHAPGDAKRAWETIKKYTLP